MKKVLSIGLLTICALAFSERQADAWVNSKFSVGLSWHLQSANNSFLWGLWKDGQVPGPEAYGHGGPFQVGPAMPPAGAFPWFGNAPGPQQGFPPETAPPPMAHHQGYYNPYQAVSYQPQGNYYPNYLYPSYQPNYGYQQAPYYWYQGR